MLVFAALQNWKMDPVSCHAEMKMSCHMAENSVPATTAIKSVLQILARCKLITVGYEKKKNNKKTTFRGEKNIWAGRELLHLRSKKALRSHQLLLSSNNGLEAGKGEIILGSHSIGDLLSSVPLPWCAIKNYSPYTLNLYIRTAACKWSKPPAEGSR